MSVAGGVNSLESVRQIQRFDVYDIIPTISQWARDRRPFVLARVVATWGSAPRQVGSAMAVASESEFVGSVSGGCVEGAVVEQATEVLQYREPRLIEFGIDDERAWSVGLSCGGRIQILLEHFLTFSDDTQEQEVGASWLDIVKNGGAGVVISWFNESDPGHCLLLPDGRVVGRPRTVDGELADSDLPVNQRRRSALAHLGGKDVFIHVMRGRETLIIIGATDIATHLVRLASHVGFETVVIDPRPVFANPARFDPAPNRIVAAWPDEALADLPIAPETYAVLLSHNPKIDDPALQILLRSQVGYIGALGGRKTQDKRRHRLLEAGFSLDEIARIKGPVGLDIGASSPAEIALSIMAEVVAVRNDRPTPAIPPLSR